jgi:uncharacterized protein (DUF433 family)
MMIKSLNLLMDYTKFIDINPDIRFGRPCIKGTRISVADVLDWLEGGMTRAEILEDYPQLNNSQIDACIAFAREPKNKSLLRL